MKGFVSTIVLLMIVSLFVFQLSLSEKLYSSALEQKLSVDEIQRVNEQQYAMEDGFRKTVYDANRDVEKRLISVSGKVISLSSGADVNYLDEAYVCYKLQNWADENNYSLNVVLVNPLDLSEKELRMPLFLYGKSFNSINEAIKKQSFGKLSLSDSFLCPAFIHSDYKRVKIELNEDLPLNSKYSSIFASVPFAFSVKSNFFGSKLSVLIPEGTEI